MYQAESEFDFIAIFVWKYKVEREASQFDKVIYIMWWRVNEWFLTYLYQGPSQMTNCLHYYEHLAHES